MSQILIIDDDPQVRDMLQAELEQEGYDVIVAEDGNEGLKRFREMPADVVITDIIMPGKEGVETLVDLRREFPTVRIIAMSGGGRMDATGYLRAAKTFGADFTFEKPVDPDELFKAIETLLAPTTL